MNLSFLDQIETIGREIEFLAQPGIAAQQHSIQQKVAALQLVIDDARQDAKRFCSSPAVVQEDESAVEILRVFMVQGHAVASARWVDEYGPDHWATALATAASAVGQMAEDKRGLDGEQVAMDIAQRSSQVLTETDSQEIDGSDSRPIE